MSAKSDPASFTPAVTLTNTKSEQKFLIPGNVLTRQSSSSLLGTTPNKLNEPPKTLGASFVGLLASKRLAKRLTSRFHHARARSLVNARISELQIQREPTYRMEPQAKFDATKVREIADRLLKVRLEGFSYSQRLCSTMSRLISDEIKDKIKALNYDRYKIVVVVFIGEKSHQGLVISSRCAWDEKLDNSATAIFQNDTLYCTATVFGVYNE